MVFTYLFTRFTLDLLLQVNIAVQIMRCRAIECKAMRYLLSVDTDWHRVVVSFNFSNELRLAFIYRLDENMQRSSNLRLDGFFPQEEFVLEFSEVIAGRLQLNYIVFALNHKGFNVADKLQADRYKASCEQA